MSATLSLCGLYRYTLTRQLPTWGGECGTVNFIMLNPSTADAKQDDPTIRRCIRFASEWGYATLLVTNLFALRATDPKELRSAADPIGPGNNEFLIETAVAAERVIAAWGVHGSFGGRASGVRDLLERNGVELRHLGLTKDGHPRHPLYLRSDAKPQRWEGSR